MNYTLEVHQWPPNSSYGGQHTRQVMAVLAIHRPTGHAYLSDTERSQWANRTRAEAELKTILMATAAPEDE